MPDDRADSRAPRLVPGAEAEGRVHPLIEPSLFYDPPYERPIEDEFAWHLVKYLKPVAALGYQVRVTTPCAPFWVDFVVELGGRRIGFECGALEAAAGSGVDPHFRDALLLGSGGLDVLYHFRGEDLLHRLHDCLLVASSWDPDLFSERGRINLETLAAPEARRFRPAPGATVARIRYAQPPEEDVYDGEAFDWPVHGRRELVVRRLSRSNPASWLRDFDAALAHFGVAPEDLQGQWARSA